MDLAYFVQGCEVVYFHCKVGHFSMRVYGGASGGHWRNCSFHVGFAALEVAARHVFRSLNYDTWNI